MITIFTTTGLRKEIQAFIDSEYRLNELVTIVEDSSMPRLPMADHITIDERGIVMSVDWYNTAPPLLFPQPLAFSKNTLLAVVYHRLDNYEKVNEFLNDHPEVLSLITETEVIDNYYSYHNAAVSAHYSNTDIAWTDITGWYRKALQSAPNDEIKAFTAKHYATLLADSGDFESAEKILREAISYAWTTDAQIELKALLTSVWLNRLTVPYDSNLLEDIKATLSECITVYEKADRPIQVGLLLLDATRVANLSNSFSEALGYVTRGINIFKEHDQLELLAQAQMSKGTLLYSWAQQGNPQFYRGAMEALQEATKVFTRNDAPQQFAEIQHLLGIVYSEIPDEAKKKAVWAAVSSSSFKEALNFFNKEDHPYEYATVCNHYGNAYIKYPASRNTDTITKALELFNEALSVRTAERYPVERALTLLNYLEASWYADNGTDEFNEVRYQDMLGKTEELLTLGIDEKIRIEALNHQQRLNDLRKVSI